MARHELHITRYQTIEALTASEIDRLPPLFLSEPVHAIIIAN